MIATPRLRQMLGWALGLLLMAWLLHKLPLAALPQALARIGWLTWLAAALALLLSYALRASRMQIVMAPGSEQRRLIAGLPMWRVMLLHNAAINVLPMRGGELSFPWLAKRELGLPVARSVAALLWMRVQDLAVLGLLAVLAWPSFTPAWRAALVGLWCLGLLCLRPAAHLLLRRLLPAHLAAPSADSSLPQPKLATFVAALRQALEEPNHHHPLSWLYTAGNWLVKLAAGAMLIAASAQTSAVLGWTGAVGGELAAILPIQGPAGVGTYEAGVLAGMAWLGGLGSAAPREAVLGAMCWHATLLLVSLAGGSLAGLAHLRRQAATDAEA